MNVISIGIFIIMVCMVAGTAESQTANPTSEEFADIARDRYIESSELPMSVAFHQTLADIRLRADDDRSMAVIWIQSEMDLEDKAADAFLEQMLVAHALIKSETAQEQSAYACSGGVPKVYGEQVYQALETLDDIRYAVSEHHLSLIEVELGSEVSSKLNDWLDRQKKNIVFVKFDHKKAHERFGTSGDSSMANACNALTAEIGGGGL